VSEPNEQQGLDASPVAQQRRVKDILLSTVMVGGGSLVTVLTGAARGKVVSLMIGPSGIGLQGLLQATLRTAGSIAGLGMSTSGVREIARLRGEGDTLELGHTLRGIGYMILTTGLLAALILTAFQRPLGRAILDDESLGWTLAVVGVGVLSQCLYSGYDAYLRGFRRVGLVTTASIIGNVVSTGMAITLVVLFRDDGIVWALVSQPICVLVIAAIVGRDVKQHLVPADSQRTKQALFRVAGLGVVLAATSFATTGAQLGARVLIARWTSLDDVGYFQAAWAISVLYLGFVLGAMSLDYYPRLAEVGQNRPKLNEMVNEQAKISMLLAGPALLGVFTFSSQIVRLLFSAKFAVSVDILRWQLMGDVLKIGSWTLSYMVLAQGRPRMYFVTEMSWNVAYLATLALLLPQMGVLAAGYAYVISSAVYFAILCLVTNRIVGFSWSRNNVVMMVVLAALAAVLMLAHQFLSTWWSFGVGLGLTLTFGTFCLRRLVHEAGFSRLLRRRKPSA